MIYLPWIGRNYIINTGIVCTYYGNLARIEMRGDSVEDGFKPTKP
jgi:hypothetical protein